MVADVKVPMGWGSVGELDGADIETDLAYALKQLRGCAGASSPFAVADRAQRALDALERIEQTCRAAAEHAAGL